jgi:rifampicin phosphotransferase
VEASFGLGEALVRGLVNPDVFKVCDGEVVKAIAASGVRFTPGRRARRGNR